MMIYCDGLCRHSIEDRTMTTDGKGRVYHNSCFSTIVAASMKNPGKYEGMKFRSGVDRSEIEELYREGRLLQSPGNAVIQPDGSMVKVK